MPLEDEGEGGGEGEGKKGEKKGEDRPKDPGALLLRFEELPAWRQDNEFVRSGYRRTQYSFLGCAKSVFGCVYPSSLNIHTHLWGALLFLLLLTTFHTTHITPTPTATWADTTVIGIFLAAAVACLSLSAAYHTCEVHSRMVASTCNGLDYAGIVILIVGSVVPCIYYGFYCSKLFQTIYLSLFALSGSLASYIVLNPSYRTPSYRSARTKVFVSLGLCGVLPVSHGLLSRGFEALQEEMGVLWLLGSAWLYLEGAVLYANRIPERLAPGSFDIFLSSHQIFHVHVLAAVLAHYQCVMTAFGYWHGVAAGACPV
ncbi:hemolysin-III related-domain-containing protein [Irpex lacteus]|nr:hemolysin-III related-domain-containing protein [Irpex lacteus]